MKAAVITGVGTSEVTTVDDPTPGPRDVIVDVAACGICGTDLHILQGEFAPTLPIIPGHEFAGKIVEIGRDVVGVRGRRPGGGRPVAVLLRVLLLPTRPEQPVRELERDRRIQAGRRRGIRSGARSPTA